MKWVRSIMALCLCICTGCTTAKLRTSTASQAGSLAELQYQQVLNNLAMFCSNPEIVPSLVNLRDGSAQIADVGSASYLGDWHRAFGSHPTLLGSRTVVEQWGMSPVTDDNEVQLLQLAYRRAAGIDETLQDNLDLANDLAHELVKQIPEVDDYRGSIVNQFEDFKNQYRNGHLNPRVANPLNLTNLDIKPLLEYVYVSSHDDKSLPRQFENTCLSTVDYKIIYDNELVRYLNVHGAYREQATLLSDKKYARKRLSINGQDTSVQREFYINWSEYDADDRPKPTVDRYHTNAKFPGVLFEAEAASLANQDSEIRYVTPEAVEVRRQVKDLEVDLLDIRTDRGWYGRGGKHDVPHDACYSGHYGDCYVWVCPGGVRDLSILTIKTLKFATLIKDESVLTVPGPRFTPSSGFPSP